MGAVASLMDVNPTLAMLDRVASAERDAQLVSGLFLGTAWMVFVLVVGVLLVAYINRRFGP